VRFTLEGTTAVVTGACGKLGPIWVDALLEAGARVAALELPGAPASPAFQDLQRRGGDAVRRIDCDITNRASLEKGLASIEKAWETPFGLVNAAALDSPPDAPPEENGPFETYPEASFDRIMSVNVKGTFLCCQVFGGAMAARGRGSIVNIASIYGMVSPDQSLYQYRRDRGEIFYKPVAYATSKSAIYNLTRYLAAYWGGKGVRVNTLTLGGVYNNQDPKFLERYNAKVPLGRMADANEYNGVVQFLLSDAASYVTGSNIVADGGFTAL